MTSAKLYRSITAGDLVLFGVLAVPGVGGLILDGIIRLNVALGLAGTAQVSPTMLLFVHLMGVMGAGLACLRLHIGPVSIGVLTTICVKLIAATLFGLFVWRGAPSVLAIFGIVDLAQGAALLALHIHCRRSPQMMSYRHNQPLT